MEGTIAVLVPVVREGILRRYDQRKAGKRE